MKWYLLVIVLITGRGDDYGASVEVQEIYGKENCEKVDAFVQRSAEDAHIETQCILYSGRGD